MGTKIQWSEYSDFVKYLINSKKIQKNIKFDMQAHFNIYIILYIHIHILYYIYLYIYIYYIILIFLTAIKNPA